MLLIPVDAARTLQWLADEAARRYYAMTGLEPVLALHTEDAVGAALNGQDTVGVVLRDGDRVVGRVDKWHLPPLPERYAAACRQTETGALLFIQLCLSFPKLYLIFKLVSG